MLACTWDAPGADRYTGTSAQAIYSFASIPLPVRSVLLEKHEKRLVDDTIVIDATSIRGKTYTYAPTIRNMHFGASKQCEDVSRHWDDRHIETALVYCEGEWCIAWPAVCGNWFLVTREKGPIPIPLAAPIVPGIPVPIVFEDGPVSMPGPISVPVEQASPEPWTYVPNRPVYMPVPIPVLPAVPEPETWVLMIGGLLFILRRSNHV